MGQQWGSGGYGPPPPPGGWGPPPGGAPPAYAPVPYTPPGHLAGPTQCPWCGSAGPHFPISKVAPAGWIVCAVLFFAFLPLCWVGLFIKQRGLQCGSCRRMVTPLM
jgi:hypothetical protein